MTKTKDEFYKIGTLISNALDRNGISKVQTGKLKKPKQGKLTQDEKKLLWDVCNTVQNQLLNRLERHTVILDKLPIEKVWINESVEEFEQFQKIKDKLKSEQN